MIRFFLYTFLYWTLPRDRVLEPEEEEEIAPLTPDATSKSDAKKRNSGEKDVELGRTVSAPADGSTRGARLAERRRSATLGSQELGRRQSLRLSKDMGRHTSLESLGSQELFGWHRDAKLPELSPGGTAPHGAEGAPPDQARPGPQTPLSSKKSPRDFRVVKRQED